MEETIRLFSKSVLISLLGFVSAVQASAFYYVKAGDAIQ